MNNILPPMFPLPQLRVRDTNAVFFDSPDEVYFDQWNYFKDSIIPGFEDVKRSIEQFGQLVGSIQTEFAEAEVAQAIISKKNKACGHDVYGWPSTATKPIGQDRFVIIVGAQKAGEKEFIYFRLAEDTTKDPNSLIRRLRPSTADSRLFSLPYKLFNQACMTAPDPGCPYAKWLYTQVTAHEILTTEKDKCNRVGQAIFDYYKNREPNPADGSIIAFDAVVRICEAAKHICSDRDITGNIERAWNLIGDDMKRWLS